MTMELAKASDLSPNRVLVCGAYEYKLSEHTRPIVFFLIYVSSILTYTFNYCLLILIQYCAVITV